MMSTSPYDCPYCLLRREIIAVKFPLFRSPSALFVCPSCGSALADRDGPIAINATDCGSVSADVGPVTPARVYERRR
jgi:hypothetical protein